MESVFGLCPECERGHWFIPPLGPCEQCRDVWLSYVEESPDVERRGEGTMGNKLLIKGTRIPVRAIRNYMDYGAGAGDIAEAYPDVGYERLLRIMRLIGFSG